MTIQVILKIVDINIPKDYVEII